MITHEFIGDQPPSVPVLAEFRERRYLQRRAEMIALLCDQVAVEAATICNDAYLSCAGTEARHISEEARRDAVEARLIALDLGSP